MLHIKCNQELCSIVEADKNCRRDVTHERLPYHPCCKEHNTKELCRNLEADKKSCRQITEM